ncbi:MAG TPA: flagellar biosynthesis anti-sigma factor FlgM [Polyangiaceae bacterium]|nr:flagellar biosynthesis anti-sigma factor FlgM [Polyangiaceae bacterium]
MRVPSGRPDVAPVTAASEAVRVEAATPVAPASAAVTRSRLESAILEPAVTALRELPEIDQEKVSLLRDALARGELPFDAAKLAALIERFHQGGRPGPAEGRDK